MLEDNDTTVAPSSDCEENLEEQSIQNILERACEWTEIENLVLKYKEIFDETKVLTPEEIYESKEAAGELLERFAPIFRKYMLLVSRCQVDFSDKEQKRFVNLFIGDEDLKAALKDPFISPDMRNQIIRKFNFVRESYGRQPREIIMSDLQLAMLILAKRYKQMGFNFCSYVYNSYGYEVARTIKKYTSDPANIIYKNCEYEEYLQLQNCIDTADVYDIEEKSHEDEMGLPTLAWMSGEVCSDIFANLTPIERKIIVKYYMENYNDRQVADELGMHINTCNQKRRHAVSKIAKTLDIDEKSIQRSRNSGKNILRRGE